MISLLLLGLLLGMRHALEADHVAAVASLATRSRGIRSTVAQGAAWGLGHTITLVVVGGACLLLRAVIPERVAAGLESVVGVMLLYLGADVLIRIRRRGIHFHVHRHDDGTVHFHAHQHTPGEAHDRAHHHHEHVHGFPLRALLVGLVHGMAGSAALLLLTLTTLSSVWLGFAYIAVFGIGSIAGMAGLAAAMAWPLHFGGTRTNLRGWYTALEVAIGSGTLLIGAWVLYHNPWLRTLWT